MCSIQDFSLINTHVEKCKEDYGVDESSNAFYFFALNLILGLQDDEILDAITDNSFLKATGLPSGHDRGIDAVYIEEIDSNITIHFFNFKYASSFENTKKNFPSSEIDKILGFLNNLFQKDTGLRNDVNRILAHKIDEIWRLFDKKNPSFVVHLCANLCYTLEKNEKDRFERELNKHSRIKAEYHTISSLVSMITEKSKKIVNAKLKAIDKNFFEKSDGDIRALIVDIDAKDLIRIVLDDEDIRNSPDLTDYEILKKYDVLEDAFESNVRVYLKQRSKINRNIKNTALSPDNHRFFYYNNGITITCDRFTYMKTARAPLIELHNIQIVNGGQTVHALYDAFNADSSKFEYVDILCRIYETQNSNLGTEIAEYTNSQNPVKSRDIRSIDITQQKLEQEFLAKGMFYERKKNQYYEYPKNIKLDAEKVGQVLMAFYNKMPAEALNKKSVIFAEKYDEIFNELITADKVLLPYKLFEKIEKEKNRLRSEIAQDSGRSDEDTFILYSSYYILYALSEFAQKANIDLVYSNIDRVWALYPIVIKTLKKIIEKEQQKENYAHIPFFKSNKLKQYLSAYLNASILKSLLEVEEKIS